ncbi:MAG: prenyltransferase, partial [Eggerthellaceae bacterium]|nr:prenyltransferase [Eggerthellaceae bacterium]
MPDNAQEANVAAEEQAAPKPRPKAKTPKNKAKEKAEGGKAQGMVSALKRTGTRKSSGKPSVFDDADGAGGASRGLFGGLTPKLMLQLAAPHTWAASIMPVFLAMCLTAADDGSLSSLMVVVLLLISVLMQSAVNTFNDYQDFVKGADTRDNQDDPTDAVLVYNDVEPYGVRNLAVVFVALAFLLGIYVVVSAGWIPLAIAINGVACLFLYSGGPKPLSYFPVGELVSGVVMGGLITMASYTALTGTFSWLVLLKSLPLIIGIGLIMFTNNTCDIEKDRQVGRATLSVMLGRKDSVIVYHSLIFLWIILIALLVAVFYPTGSLGLLFLLASYPPLLGLFRNPFVHKSRQAAMSAITSAN